MGMAATQARLLTLTNRKNRIGYNLSMLSAQKMSLAREADAVSTKYTNALNEKVLKWSNDAGQNYYDLTYDTLMNPSALNNYEPYMLTDMSGKVVVDNDYLKYAQMISPNGACGGDYNSNRTKILSELTGIPEEDFNNVESNNNALKNLDTEIAKHLAKEPAIQTTTADAALSALGNVSGDAVTAKTGKVGSNFDVTKDTTWSDIIQSISGGANYVTYLHFNKDKTMSAEDANAEFLKILESFADSIGNLGIDEFSQEKLDAATQNTYNLFTQEYAYDESDKKAADKIQQAGENADNYNTIAHYHDEKQKFIFTWDSAGDSYAVSLTNMVNVFLNYLLSDEETQSSISTSSCPGLDLNTITVTDAASKAEHDQWQETYDNLVNQRSELEESSSLVFDAEEEKLIDFYDAIFEAIATNGWTYNEYINDNEYLNNVLQNGMYNITKAERGNDGQWDYDESAATTCQNIYQVADSSAENKATAEYELEKTRIQNKEEAIDVRMKKLETEQSAINEMLESYRSMINDNAERTFDVFS